MSLVYFVVTLIVLLLFYAAIELRLRVIVSQSRQSLLRAEAIMKHFDIRYPAHEQLMHLELSLMEQGDLAEACNHLTEKFGCTFEEAQFVLNEWKRSTEI